MPCLYKIIVLSWVKLSSLSCFLALGLASWCPASQFVHQSDREFERKTDKFWRYEEQSNSWVEVELPYDLLSCHNENCTKVGTIRRSEKSKEETDVSTGEQKERSKDKDDDDDDDEEKKVKTDMTSLPQRKRISLTRMSESSIWVTGESGSIYERFWNGVQWVIAPHDLPKQAGKAVSVFTVNQTILALCEEGNLYQMQLTDGAEPDWVEFSLATQDSSSDDSEQQSGILIKSGVVSYKRIYFCTKTGSLVELAGIDPLRWVDHGRPPGANVAVIAEATTIRSEVVFTISSTGDLYEYDRSSKPSWKKHIWKEVPMQHASLMPAPGCSSHGLHGAHSISLFLLTKGGDLVERRMQHRKWKWIIHGSPKNHRLTSITSVPHEERNKESYFFFTTAAGYIFEHQSRKYSETGRNQDDQIQETWVNHMHPLHAKVARGISGLHIQVSRMLFPLDDGRLAELHLAGLGGESWGPHSSASARKKTSNKYAWSILDAPETEGWNAEYCIEGRGPSNCITGVRDDLIYSETTNSMARRKRGAPDQQSYISLSAFSSTTKSVEDYHSPENWTSTNFRLRLMHGGRSFFLVTDDGMTFEYLYAENIWLWMRHEHSTPMKGAIGNYNGSLFLVDTHGNLIIRERNNNELSWINCTAMRKGKHVNGGPPWDRFPRRDTNFREEDALFFVSRSGRLLQFTVAQRRKLKWKDCRHPPNVKVACIMDQEIFRENIVFVLGRNGRLYQYNKVSELWHEHYQSQHLVLSRFPGTASRSSSIFLRGSLYMLSEEGGLIEYQWNANDGWNWVEHGKPCESVTLVGSPGPCFKGSQLFLIGSDGKVYQRYLDQKIWKWKCCGFPFMEKLTVERDIDRGSKDGGEQTCCIDKDYSDLEKDEKFSNFNRDCNPKVATTRPIPFTEDSVIFELRDGRLAEMQHIEEAQWVWSRIIGTPTSLCMENYLTALAS